MYISRIDPLMFSSRGGKVLRLARQKAATLAALVNDQWAIDPAVFLILKRGSRMEVIQMVSKNIDWIFSGIGVAAIVGLFGWLSHRKSHAPDQMQSTTPIIVNNSQSVTIHPADSESPGSAEGSVKLRLKSAISILFIDDDVKFQVVNILKRNGWTNTKIIKDIVSLEQPEVASADIFFVDIQGVGLSLGFRDHGLGLVVALRKKYPTKKIVIYSAENANPFHVAFQQANERISKDADPYEFMEAVDRLSA